MKFFRKKDATLPRGNKKLTPKKLNVLGVLALVVASSLIATLSPFMPNTASAVTADDVLNRARAWSILNAVIDLRSQMNTTITLDDADSCRFFSDDSIIYVGPHTTGNPDNGGDNWGAMTNNTGNANAGLNSVGILGCRNLLEKIGYTYGSGSVMNQPANFGNVLSANITKAVTVPDAFFGAHIGDGSPGDALSYAMLYADLTTACGWQFRNSFTDNSTADNKSRNQEAQANGHDGSNVGSHYYTYTYENGVAGLNTYYKNGGREDGVQVGSKTGFASTGGNSASTDCAGNTGDTIPSKLFDNHRFADAYAALLKPGSQYTPGTCKERYTTQPELDACDDGYQNKNTAGWTCQAHYNTQPALNACIYGHDTATGGKNDTTPPPTSGTPAATASKPTCVIEGIGWIICPVVNLMAKIVDGAYDLVSSLLKIQPLLTTGTTAPIFQAWSVMRNFANVAFVIAFLIIIFSQLTSVGITTYGIKKMMPKLVVAAILVNVSYWICSIAVDLSNILGGSLDGMFQGLSATVVKPTIAGAASTGAGWTGIAGGVLAGTLVAATILYATLSALLPMLVVVLLAIVTVFLVLTIRQALIILLIVVAPLAFVAFLLPNTEGLFKKWRELFQTLLLMYPIISLIFGASALASTVIMASANGPYKIVVQIMGAGVSIIPLIITPIVMKTAGNLLGKVGAVVNNPNKGPFDRLKKRAEGARDRRGDIAGARRLGRAKSVLNGTGGGLGSATSRRRRVAAWAAGSGATTGLNQELKAANSKKALSDAKQNYAAGRGADLKYAQAIAGPTGNASKVQAAAIAAQKAELAEGVKNAKTEMTARLPPGDIKALGAELERAIEEGDGVRAEAAQDLLLASGSKGIDQYRSTMAAADAANPDFNTSDTATSLRQNIIQNHSNLKGTSNDIMKQALDGGKTLDHSNNAGTWNNLNDEEIAGQKKVALQFADSTGALNVDQANRILASPELSKKLSPETRTILEDVATRPVGTPPPPPPKI